MAPGAERAVTREDVMRVHQLLERCIAHGMTQQEAMDTLSRVGVDARFTKLVWTRLETENHEFFVAYHSQLMAKASLERLSL